MWWRIAVIVSVLLILVSFYAPLSIIETIGFLTAVWCVWEAVFNRERNWPIGAINCVAFFIVFAHSHLWGNMVLQIIFLLQAFWGSWLWQRGGEENTALPINGLRALKPLEWVVVLTVVILFVTQVLTAIGGVMPFWDTVTTILSIIANQLLVRRRLENWYWWLVIDSISVFLFASQGLSITTITYVVYVGLSVFAIIQWKKQSAVKVAVI